MRDYYKILGIDYTTNQEEIHKAYRKMVLIYHPDIKGGGSEEKIKIINEAYSVLSDKIKKFEYDEKYLKIVNHKFIKKFFGENEKFYAGDQDTLNSFLYKKSKRSGA